MKGVNQTILQLNIETGACYVVAKYTEIAFEREKMVKGEGLKVLNKRIKNMDPDENEIFKFLGVDQADGIKIKEQN